MFKNLTGRLDSVFKTLRGYGRISEKNVADSMREVRRVLLEADVNYRVAKDFIARVQERALGQKVLRSISPGQQIIKIFRDELTVLLGGEAPNLDSLLKSPGIVMMVGLQGSGKTTTAVKLALFLGKRGKRVVLGATDLRRPAAVHQLGVLARRANLPIVTDEHGSALSVAQRTIEFCSENRMDGAVLDTAGRLHVDEGMMAELKEMKEAISPDHIFFVADGMTGQDAVNSASEFLRWLDFDGVILTKLDGDERGGAALSIRAVTGKPIFFGGTGEGLGDLEVFHPERMASRILGLGDVISLVEKVEEAVEEEAAARMAEKLARQTFDLEDFLDQIKQLKKMGPLDQLLGLLPGLGGKLKSLKFDERSLVPVEAIIQSMTPEERRKPGIIDGSRRQRIAAGSGTSVHQVNQLLKQFFGMQKMMKRMGDFKMSERSVGRDFVKLTHF
ncbi:signal recognition particle protein [candidate division KSB1 bacterium]|nr:signal recognition particle protein [candidate division KSB1 bacterium]